MKTMTDERRADAKRYFPEQPQSCGCVWLGQERADTCETHSRGEDRETVEMMRDYSRICARCNRIAYGKTRLFTWNEEKQCYTASEWEAPKGWLTLAHNIEYSYAENRRAPTTFLIAVCGDCAPAVLEFAGWKKPWA